MAATSQGAIEQILNDLRDGIDNRRFIPINRPKNLATLSQLGITWGDAKNEIRSLCVCDYVSGPSIDYGRPSSDRFWVFKKVVLGHVIYIKFKIEYQIDKSVKVVSFHIDEVN